MQNLPIIKVGSRLMSHLDGMLEKGEIMSHQKDPIDKFIEGMFYAGATAAWAITATAGTLVVKLLRKSPEKRLKNMKHISGWGEQGQMKVCSRCQALNDNDAPLCVSCGARF